MDYEKLGKRIRDERLLLRLTIEQLAERANALGTTVDSLLSDSIDKYKDDTIVKEISTILYSMDDYGKHFILDIVKRYSYYDSKRKEV